MTDASTIPWPASRQRSAAVGLTLAQAAALGLLMQEPLFAASAALIALVGWMAPHTRLIVRVAPRNVFIAIICLGAAKYFLASRSIPAELRFIRTEAAYEVACGCLLTQLSVFFLSEYATRIPHWFAVVSGIGLIASGDVRTDDSRRLAMIGLVAVYFVLFGLFATFSRRPRKAPPGDRSGFRIAVLTMVFVVATAGGALGSQLLFRYQHQLDRMISHYLSLAEPRIARAGFSGLGGLSDVSNWQRSQGETIALRIVCETCPEYLRGRAFDYFEDDRWQVSDSGRRVGPSRQTSLLDRGRPDDRVFELREPPAGPLSPMEVWPIDLETAGHCFLPLRSVAVLCPSETLHLDDALIVQRPSGDFASSYVGLLSMESLPLPLQPHARDYLQLPTTLDSRVNSLARDICRNASTSREKMEAVQKFFQTNFQYQWGLRIPREEDRLTYFLIDRPPAHCEYFATASVILLRAVGVPARYITGFVVSEQSGLDNKWVARRRDSHAWAEAYDEVTGNWIIVESTPFEGIPASSPPEVSKQFQEILAHQLLRLQELLTSGLLWQWTAIALAWSVAALLVVLAALSCWRSLGRGKRRQTASLPLDDSLLRLMRERVRLDQFLAARGIRRAPAQTLLQFAQDLESRRGLNGSRSLAQWYREYVRLRFRQDHVDDEAIAALRASRRRLLSVRGREG